MARPKSVSRWLASLLVLLALVIAAPAYAQQVVQDTISASGDKFEQPIGRAGSMGVQIEGTFDATLVFEVTGHAVADGATWIGVDAFPTTGSAVTQTVCAGTCSGAWTIITSGFTHVRVRASAYASGSATVRFIYPEAGAYVPRSGGSFSGELTSPIGDSTKAESLSITWATDIDPMLIGPAASGGLGHPCIVYSDTNQAETVCLAQAGQVYHVLCSNQVGSDVLYLQLFDDSDTPVAGTDDSVFNLGIPGHADIAGFIFANLYGETFANGIGVAITGAIGTDDGTAGVAGAVCNIYYVSS